MLLRDTLVALWTAAETLPERAAQGLHRDNGRHSPAAGTRHRREARPPCRARVSEQLNWEPRRSHMSSGLARLRLHAQVGFGVGAALVLSAASPARTTGSTW